MASTPSRMLLQYSLVFAALGNRQPIPTMAKGDEAGGAEVCLLLCFFVMIYFAQSH